MLLSSIATEIKVTGSKTFGFYCSFYIDMSHHKKKAEIKDGSMYVYVNSKKYFVKHVV